MLWSKNYDAHWLRITNMIYVYIACIVFLSLWITSHLRALIQNYYTARATGLPVVICPYDPDSVSIHSTFDG
jgi:hypothetical protein